MSLDEQMLLYSLSCTFENTIGASLGENAQSFQKSHTKNFSKLPPAERMHYTKYSLQLAESFSEHVGIIKEFEINLDPGIDIPHDFSITPKKGEKKYVSLSHKDIHLRDVIPEKFARVCKYKKNTNIYRNFSTNYQKINENAYKKISSKERYNCVSDKLKQSAIFYPICELIIDSFAKKRKCAPYLYRYLFEESERMVLKLYKNRFVVYDFGTILDDVQSFKMKMTGENEITITFNNGAEFILSLKTNSNEIKEKLSLKFSVQFKTMDKLFAVSNKSV